MGGICAAAPALDYERQIVLGGDRIGGFPMKVVSASDWLVDFDRVGWHVFRESGTEQEIFVLYYLLGLASNATMKRIRFAGWKVSMHSCNFAATASSFQQTRAIVRQVDEARWALEVHRTSHPRASSVDFARRLIETIEPPRDLNPGS